MRKTRVMPVRARTGGVMLALAATLATLAAPGTAWAAPTPDTAPATAEANTPTSPAVTPTTTATPPTADRVTSTTDAAEPGTSVTTAAAAAATDSNTAVTAEALDDPIVTPLAGVVDLTKTVTQPVVQPGQEFGYRLIANCSSLTDACLNATIVDILPAGFDVTSIPGNTAERTVTYVAGTRTLTIVFTIPLPAPPNPAGSTGIPAGESRQIDIGMRLPVETPFVDGTVVTNTATLTSTGSGPDTASADIEVDILVRPSPVATKAWVDGTAIAQSDETSTMTLGIRNASSTSTPVTSLTITDLNAATFDRFDVTRLGPVTYPGGTNQVLIAVCTQTLSTCSPTDATGWITTGVPVTGPGPFTPPPPATLGAITGVRFTFSNSAGTVLPYDATGGTVQLGMVLRDTIRSSGAPYAPTVREDVQNCAVPSLVAGTPTTGTQACATYSVVPNIVTVTAAKTFFSDTDHNFASDGSAILNANSPVSMVVTGRNTSPFDIAVLEIIEPSAVTGNEFNKVDITGYRVGLPAGAQRGIVTVTCRSGANPAPRTFTASATTTQPTGCATGVAAARIVVRFEGTDALGVGTIDANATGTLSLTGNLNNLVTSADVGTGAGVGVSNSATVNGDNPINSAGAATAEGSALLRVQNPTSTIGSGQKTSTGTNLVPGQPLTFNSQFTNSGNLALTDVVYSDPADPTAPPNPFDVVRLTSVTVTPPSGVAFVTEVWDPNVSTYVAYNAADAALLERARGLRVRITGSFLPGQTFRLSYNVVVRDGIPAGTTMRNCAVVTAPGGVTTPLFCAPVVTTVPATTSGSVQKLFAPTTLIRPVAGLQPQQSQLRVRIQNNGSLNLNRLVVTDTDADFFDAVDWVGPMVVNRPPGADRARLEVCTTACASGTFVAQRVVNLGGNNVTVDLPVGVAAADVQGFRVTFFRNDGAYLLTPGTNYPTGGGCPSSSVCVTVRARETLRSAPSTPIPNPLENTASGAGESVNQTPGTTFPIGDTTATIVINPGTATMDIDKGPQSRIAPGESAPFTLDVENTGTAPIPDLVVVDPIPDGLILDQIFAGEGVGRPFRITYNLPAGVTPPTNVVYQPVPDPTDPNRIGTVRWSFPGFNLPPGGRVIINFQVLLEPGTPANQVITNVAGVSSSQANFVFTCTPDDLNDGTATNNPAYGPGLFCTSSTTVTSLQGTSFASAKWVSGDESLGWVFTLDAARPRVALDDPRCPRLFIDGDTYTRYPCAAMVLAGNTFKFLLRMTNQSNEAFAQQIALVDRLPEIGDTGVILTQLTRDTEWNPRPLLTDGIVRLIGGGEIVSTGYTTSGTPCTNNLDPALPPCPAGSYGAFTPDARAFQTVIDFSGAGGLAPGASYGIEFDMNAPVDLADPSSTPIAWNSFAHTDFLVVEGGDDIVLGPTEPIKAGIAIPYGQVRVSKEEVTPPPGIVLPPYKVSYTCTVNETEVASATDVEVAGGASFLLPLVPVGAECSIWETDAGGAVPDTDPDNPIVITVEDLTTPDDPQEVVLSNEYRQGALQITKVVEGDGVGLPLEGGGAWGDGPFTVNTDCRYPVGGSSLLGFPRTDVFNAGETVAISPVPVGAECTVTEIDDGGAWNPSHRVDGVGRALTNPPSTTVIITPDGDPQTVEIDPNEVEVINPFLLTGLRIVKTISGEGSELATQDFVFSVECEQPGDPGRVFPPVIATIDRPSQTEVLVEGLPVGAVCAVIEIDDGGADGDTPRLVGTVETVPLDEVEPVQTVEVDNPFSGGQLMLSKVVNGPGAGAAAAFQFELLVTCERPVTGGTFEPFLSRTVTITAASPVVLNDLIPIGSRCWAEETDSQGATTVGIDFDSADNAAIVTPDDPLISIVATNTYDVGDLVINKVITGPGASFADRPFTFAVDCTLNGNPQPSMTVSITPPATSVTVPGLSTGAQCVITETDAGGADAPAVVVPSSVTIGVGTAPPASVTATNTFSVGHVRLVKVIDGPGTATAANLVFTLQVVCERPTATGFVEVLRRSVDITAGAPVTVDTALPIGSRCWATETNSAGATSSSVDHSRPDNAVFVTVAVPTATITATNTFDPGGLVNADQIASAPASEAAATMASTGGGTSMLLPALLLLGAGSIILLITRRRPAFRPRD